MVREFTLSSRRAGNAIDFSGDLNAEQLAVATSPGGPMLVVAGAGTGKTRALTYRLAWLVRQGVDPARILLVTFTNRAAREMLGRVEAILGQDLREMWGGTFHHVANRILRVHGRQIGVQPSFTILDREDARQLIGSCVDDLAIDTKSRRFPSKNVLLAISSFTQNTLEPLDKVLSHRHPQALDFIDDIRRVLDRYAEKKRGAQLLDYDDLLTGWLELLVEHEQVRELLAERFLHVLVDEYQDTNAVQGAIVDLIAQRHQNVCVVGDDSQSIYSFRGATFRNIFDFVNRYPDAQTLRLETNYRSTPEILALANASIACNAERLPKELRAVRRSGLRPAVVNCYDGSTQSRFVAEYVLELLNQGWQLRDLAVLYRSHWHSMEIQLELQRRNIPFQVRGGLRFFEQAHIKDVLGYVRVIHNPLDEIAWLRILPHLPRIGEKLALKFWRHLASSIDPMATLTRPETIGLFPRGARPFYSEMAELIQNLALLQGGPAAVIDMLLAESYDDYLKSHFENPQLRREDIEGVIVFAAQYKTLDTFLADVALAGEFSGERVVGGGERDDALVLSTVHQAKGLEWPVVFVPWLVDGRFPSELALKTQAEEEEERRIFHVAATRAMDELYLIVPRVCRNRSRGRLGTMTILKPSRFVTELDARLFEPMRLQEAGTADRKAAQEADRVVDEKRAVLGLNEHDDDYQYDFEEGS